MKSFSGRPVFLFAFSRLSLLLLLSFYFVLLSSATAQIKIKEKVEIKPSSNIVTTERLNKTASDMMTIRADISYNSQSFNVGNNQNPKWAHVFISSFYIKRVGAPVPILNEAHWTEGGVSLTAQTERPSSISVPVTILVNGGFTGTTGNGNLYTITYPECCTGADVKVDVYVDDVLQPKNYRSVGYANFAVSNLIYPAECGDGATPCSGEQEAPEIVYEEKPYPDHLSCSSETGPYGHFMPWLHKKKNFYEPYKLEVCFDTTENYWQYKVENGNIISARYSLEVCLEYLRQRFRTIENLSEVANIDSADLCQAYKDFNARYRYGQPSAANSFFIVEATEMHEIVHLNQFLDIMYDIYYNLNFKDKFISKRFSCEDANNVSDALKLGEDYYRKTLDDLRKKIRNRKTKENGKKGSKRRAKYEQATQDHRLVTDTIDEYLIELFNRMFALNPNFDPFKCN